MGKTTASRDEVKESANGTPFEKGRRGSVQAEQNGQIQEEPPH